MKNIQQSRKNSLPKNNNIPLVFGYAAGGALGGLLGEPIVHAAIHKLKKLIEEGEETHRRRYGVRGMSAIPKWVKFTKKNVKYLKLLPVIGGAMVGRSVHGFYRQAREAKKPRSPLTSAVSSGVLGYYAGPITGPIYTAQDVFVRPVKYLMKRRKKSRKSKGRLK